MKIDIWMPVHRNVEAMTTLCLLEMQKWMMENSKHEVRMKMLVGESLISRGRNTIANNFLSSDADYLLMIDSDLIFERDILEKLLSYDKKLIGANYVHKTSVRKYAGKPDDFDIELSEASFVPTGMMLIHKSVFEKMKDHVPKMRSSEHDPCYGFFNTMVDDDQYLSEDWAFSHRCRKAGITGYIANHLQLGHIGNKIYR